MKRITEAGRDLMGASEFLRRQGVGHGDATHPCRERRPHPMRRILDDQAAGRGDVHQIGGFQVTLRMGLPASHVFRRHDRLEPMDSQRLRDVDHLFPASAGRNALRISPLGRQRDGLAGSGVEGKVPAHDLFIDGPSLRHAVLYGGVVFRHPEGDAETLFLGDAAVAVEVFIGDADAPVIQHPFERLPLVGFVIQQHAVHVPEDRFNQESVSIDLKSLMHGT